MTKEKNEKPTGNESTHLTAERLSVTNVLGNEGGVAVNNKLLSGVGPIHGAPAMTITGRNNIIEYVEEPLVEACEIFYDKNIKTTSTSANRNDIEAGYVRLIINYDFLSPANKKIAEEYGKLIKSDIGIQSIIISILVNASTTVFEVVKRSKEIAESFEKQERLYPFETFTIDERKEQMGLTDSECNDPYYDDGHNLIRNSDLYFDSKSELFYRSFEEFLNAMEMKLAADFKADPSRSFSIGDLKDHFGYGRDNDHASLNDPSYWEKLYGLHYDAQTGQFHSS